MNTHIRRIFIIVILALPQTARAETPPRMREYVAVVRDIDVVEQDIKRNFQSIREINTTSNYFWKSKDTKEKVSRLLADQASLIKIYDGLYSRKRELAKELQATYVAWGRTSDYSEWLLSGQHQGNFAYTKRKRSIELAEDTAHCSLIVGDEPLFFESEDAFENWVRRNTRNATEKAIYHGQQSRYIRACLNNETIPVGKSVRVRYTSVDKCKDYVLWASTRSSDVNIELVKHDGYVEAKMNLGVIYRGKSENKELAFERFKTALPEVENFFAENGIKLSLTVHGEVALPDNASMTADLSKAEQTIFLWDEYERQNAENWSSMGHAGSTMSSRTQRLIHVHETAHLLGAPDRYPDEDCPDRPVGPPESIMYDSDGMNAEGQTVDVKFIADDLVSMLKPLCGK